MFIPSMDFHSCRITVSDGRRVRKNIFFNIYLRIKKCKVLIHRTVLMQPQPCVLSPVAIPCGQPQKCLNCLNINVCSKHPHPWHEPGGTKISSHFRYYFCRSHKSVSICDRCYNSAQTPLTSRNIVLDNQN